MKKKIGIVILSLILLNGSLFFASGQNIDNITYNLKNNHSPPLPGDMDGGFMPFLQIQKNNQYQPQRNIVDFNQNIAFMVQNLNQQIYLGFLENLTSFGPKVTTSEACENAAEYIHSQFLDMGLDTRYHQWDNQNGLYGRNVEASIYGEDETSDEIYLICAHYDSVPGSPGADDDGSGVAAVLSAAKLMSQYQFNNTIRFVTFSGEEQGLWGSGYYVQEVVENEDNIIAVLNIDMIGYTSDEEGETKIKVFEDEYSTWLTDYTTIISQEYDSIFDLEVINSGYSYGSDHYYFWQAGINAIFYHEYQFNAYYHSPSDVIENMNIDYAIKSSKLIITTLADLAEMITTESPYKPEPPVGETRGSRNTEYIYTTTTTDPQDDQVFYLFDWDDGSDSGWLGPYASGEEIQASHIWERIGRYEVRVKAKDIDGHESQWSDPLPIVMPKYKNTYTSLLNLIQKRIDRFMVLLERFFT